MCTWPTDRKRLKAQISSYRRKLKAELNKFGRYRDGYGKRLWLFHLYFLLGDLPAAAGYIAWYEAEFANDMGDEAQLVCWALLLHRMSRNSEASYQLARAFDCNPTFLNSLAGTDATPYGIWGEQAMALHATYVPEAVIDAITESDREWLRTEWSTPAFADYRAQRIEYGRSLAHERDRTARRTLVHTQQQLLESLKPSIARSAPDELWLPFSGAEH